MVVGYKLVGPSDEVLETWGGVWGQCPGLPAWLRLPSGDTVGAPSPDVEYQGCRLVLWEMEEPPVVVPSSCSRLGLKRALEEVGTWTAVKAAIAADPAVQEEWDLATLLVRTDPLVQDIILQLALTEEQVDALLVRANALVA